MCLDVKLMPSIDKIYTHTITHFHTIMPERWELPRKTKKDKARRNEEIYGKYTPKHVRMSEALAEKRIAGQSKPTQTEISQKDKKMPQANKYA